MYFKHRNSLTVSVYILTTYIIYLLTISLVLFNPEAHIESRDRSS